MKEDYNSHLYDVYYRNGNGERHSVRYFGHSKIDVEKLFNSEKYFGEEIIEIRNICDQCIYGYHYDFCNANWTSKKQYDKMLKKYKCPYYSDGHKMYLDHITSEETK